MQKPVVLVLGTVVCIALFWPVSSNAKGGGSQGGQHNDITITKSTDKSSPKMVMKQTTPTKNNGATTKNATVQAETKTTTTKGTGRANFDVFTVTKGIDTATPRTSSPNGSFNNPATLRGNIGNNQKGGRY